MLSKKMEFRWKGSKTPWNVHLPKSHWTLEVRVSRKRTIWGDSGEHYVPSAGQHLWDKVNGGAGAKTRSSAAPALESRAEEIRRLNVAPRGLLGSTGYVCQSQGTNTQWRPHYQLAIQRLGNEADEENTGRIRVLKDTLEHISRLRIVCAFTHTKKASP